MVRLTFDFNEEALVKYNVTKDELLAEIREYSKENDIEETSFGVFEKDGEQALGTIIAITVKILNENTMYLKYLNCLELDEDGEKENFLFLSISLLFVSTCFL